MFYDKDGIYVIDDFIPEESQKFLENLFLNDANFPFYYNSSSNGYNQEENIRVITNRNTFDHSQFTHLLWWLDNDEFFYGDKDNSFRKSDYYETVIDIFINSFYGFFSDNNFDILRMKVNLNTSHPRTRKFLSPHVDSPQKMWSAIYYVNDVPNSYTLIGKQFYDGNMKNKFTVSKKIESKRGRCVLFDSRRYHSAGKCPFGKTRVVLNTMIGRLNDL
tara:strand:- start:7570 stop:8223 length:654 start_codon:yes stop_codon:yes gene_type:complete